MSTSKASSSWCCAKRRMRYAPVPAPRTSVNFCTCPTSSSSARAGRGQSAASRRSCPIWEALLRDWGPNPDLTFAIVDPVIVGREVATTCVDVSVAPKKPGVPRTLPGHASAPGGAHHQSAGRSRPRCTPSARTSPPPPGHRALDSPRGLTPARVLPYSGEQDCRTISSGKWRSRAAREPQSGGDSHCTAHPESLVGTGGIRMPTTGAKR